jgi:alpha-galactosidase
MAHTESFSGSALARLDSLMCIGLLSINLGANRGTLKLKRKRAIFPTISGLICATLVAGVPQSSTAAPSLPTPSTVTGISASSAQLAPHINGPSVFGVRPNHPFFYSIPATGERPMNFEVGGLPKGLTLNPDTGAIQGSLCEVGEYTVELRTNNKHGRATRQFVIKCGEQICLTPPMGWNSWNCWATSVNQDKVVRAARAMVASGLADHGWTYINIDDSWQGDRSEMEHALRGNDKFPDIKALCEEVHRLGLKVGIYSTPWITSYAGFCGGSSDNAGGEWATTDDAVANRRPGKTSFDDADARQWAAWGIDYLKYDWNPIDVPHAASMFRALRDSGRDIVLSLSNAADVSLSNEWPKVANCWRTTGDIGDRWGYRKGDEEPWRYSVSEIAFSQDAWSGASGPGHWNDPDMLVLGRVGWGPSLHGTRLTPSEQLSHFTMWCMLSAPLILGCDLEQLDAFTLSLLTNDEVLAIDQDALGQQATRVATVGPLDLYLKTLEDGSHALALFNRADIPESFIFNKLGPIGFNRTMHVRDLWNRRALPDAIGEITGEVPGHGVLLLRLFESTQ